MKKMCLETFLLSSLSLAFSGQAFADDFSVTEEIEPHRMLVLSSAGGTSIESFYVLHGDLNDIPYGSKTGTITGISYVSASFSDSTSETAELCFHQPYFTEPLGCQEITPNFSGMVTAFNGQAFRAGVRASIYNRVEATGSFHYAEPNRKMSITFHYTTD